MAAYQVISEKGKPKFVVFPVGDREAVEDYLDELWAEDVVKGLESRKGEKYFTLEEAKSRLGLNNPKQAKKTAKSRRPVSSKRSGVWRGHTSAVGKPTG